MKLEAVTNCRKKQKISSKVGAFQYLIYISIEQQPLIDWQQKQEYILSKTNNFKYKASQDSISLQAISDDLKHLHKSFEAKTYLVGI